MKTKILVLCTGNSCRSQIAEGYLKFFSGDMAEIYSAGVEAHGLNPLAVEIMNEDGIDISGQTSDIVDKYKDVPFDFVITVCDNAKERCPNFPSTSKRVHYNFTDPSKAKGTHSEILNEFRTVRNEIKDFCRNFVIKNIAG